MSEAAANAALSLAPGAVGGFCNVLSGHPIDLVKVRLQVAAASSAQQAGLLGTLRSIFARQGVRGLYQGVSAPLVAVVPAFAVSFGSYEWAKYQIMVTYNSNSKNNNNTNNTNNSSPHPQPLLSVPQLAAAGGVSGLALAAVLGPLERIKCLLQVSTAPNNGGATTFRGMVVQCYQQGGVRSLLRGTLLTVCRDLPGNAVYFGTYEGLRRSLSREGDSRNKTTAVTIVAGGLAGVANWMVVLPVDVIKSRWQTTLCAARYPTVRHCVRELLATEGWRALFRGLTPAVARAFPSNAACFLGVETTRQLLQSWRQDDGE